MKRAFLQVVRFLFFIILTALRPFAFFITAIIVSGASFMRLFSYVMGAQELISTQAMCFTILGANMFYFGLVFLTDIVRPRIEHN